jgi:hypothetical protein
MYIVPVSLVQKYCDSYYRRSYYYSQNISSKGDLEEGASRVWHNTRLVLQFRNTEKNHFSSLDHVANSDSSLLLLPWGPQS